MRRCAAIAMTALVRNDIVFLGYPRLSSRSRPMSGGIDGSHADHAQRRHARYEEILAAAGLHELRNALDDEGWPAGLRIGRDDELGLRLLAGTGRVVADERTGVVARIGI